LRKASRVVKGHFQRLRVIGANPILSRDAQNFSLWLLPGVEPGFSAVVLACLDRREFSWADPLGQLGNGQTLLRVFQDRFHLFARHTLKPFEEIIHRRAAFKILE
jgi:hypothetical protein